MSDRPVCLLLLPRRLDGFILRDQAIDLLERDGVVAAGPPRLPYGVVARLPRPAAGLVAGLQARVRLARLRRGGRRPAAIAIFHPVQMPLAEALLARAPAPCELWYGRWDRYEAAYDAGPRLRRRLFELHERAASASALTFVASAELARLERETGRAAQLVTLAADSFPDLEGRAPVIAVSLGHIGRRTDWRLLREVSERLPELIVLMIGARHDDECRGDPDFLACIGNPAFLWLGTRSDEEAARLIACADVGIVPFRVEPFNDAGLPYRILKYARLGRRTVAPDLAGVRTWERAVTTAADAERFAQALRAEAGRRADPDQELRAWALEQTAAKANEPLHRRLAELGIGAPGG